MCNSKEGICMGSHWPFLSALEEKKEGLLLLL